MLAFIILIKTTQASRVRGATLVASAGKESTCNAGDSGLISGLGRSAGEGIGYPLQYSWASLAAQLAGKQGGFFVCEIGFYLGSTS